MATTKRSGPLVDLVFRLGLENLVQMIIHVVTKYVKPPSVRKLSNSSCD